MPGKIIHSKCNRIVGFQNKSQYASKSKCDATAVNRITICRTFFAVAFDQVNFTKALCLTILILDSWKHDKNSQEALWSATVCKWCGLMLRCSDEAFIQWNSIPHSLRWVQHSAMQNHCLSSHSSLECTTPWKLIWCHHWPPCRWCVACCLSPVWHRFRNNTLAFQSAPV